MTEKKVSFPAFHSQMLQPLVPQVPYFKSNFLKRSLVLFVINSVTSITLLSFLIKWNLWLQFFLPICLTKAKSYIANYIVKLPLTLVPAKL